jgi:SapC
MRHTRIFTQPTMVKASMPLFYNSLVALDRKAHVRLKVRPPDDFSFAADAALLPLVTAEFGPVARDYPIVFMREGDNVVPVALTGLPQGKNLFVDGSGKWNARYVPAYVRRYPFVFVETAPENFTVCIDPTSKFLTESEGVPLFGSDGEPTSTLKETIDRLGDYQRMVKLTRTFMERLAAANLLMEANAKANLPDGRSFEWRGFWIVEEARFRELPEATVKDWFATGELGLIYAHLLSLGNLAELPRRQTEGNATEIKAL